MPEPMRELPQKIVGHIKPSEFFLFLLRYPWKPHYRVPCCRLGGPDLLPKRSQRIPGPSDVCENISIQMVSEGSLRAKLGHFDKLERNNLGGATSLVPRGDFKNNTRACMHAFVICMNSASTMFVQLSMQILLEKAMQDNQILSYFLTS